MSYPNWQFEMRAIKCEHDGDILSGELYLPQGDRQDNALVLVMHTALDLGAHVREVARKLTDLGYAALVTGMFGGDFGGDPAKTGALFAGFAEKPERLRARVVAWLNQARTLPEIDSQRIAAIGYCFGGQCVLELARSGTDIKAAVSFHGLLKTHAAAQAGAIRAMVQVWTGGRDPYAPTADVDAFRAEMEVAGAEHQIMLMTFAEHGFTDKDAGALGRPGISYDALADAVSWAGTVALLEIAINATD
jgi:dienelactone hydrolase